MRRTSAFETITAGILFPSITAALLGLTWLMGTSTEISQILLVIAGMTTMLSLTTFQRVLEKDEQFVTSITFNEVFLSRAIAEEVSKSHARPGYTNAAGERTRSNESKGLPLWDLSASQLIGVDNALALARLRIDLERELRGIAHEVQIDLSIRPVGITRLTEELIHKEVLPAVFLETLREVATVCNRGIHGEKISDDLAASVLRVGDQLLE